MEQRKSPRKVALVANCLLNQNAKVCEGARYRGVVSPVVEALRSRGYVLQQLPCPELAFAGARRWWAVYEQYDTPAYRAHGVLQLPPPGEHGLLLAVIADQVQEYSHHGYAVVAIGVRGEAGDGLHWHRVAPLLRHRGVALPPRHIIRPDVDAAVEGQRLTRWLAAYDLPVEEQHRWR